MDQIPVIGVSVNEQVGHRSLVLQTHIAADCTDEALNALFDRLLKAADRQKLYYETREELAKLRMNLDNHELNLDNMIKDMSRVDVEKRTQWEESGRKGAYVPTPKDRQERANIAKNVDSFETNIKRLKKAIAEHEAILEKIGKT